MNGILNGVVISGVDPRIIRGGHDWLQLWGGIQNSVAIADKRQDRARPRRFMKNDTVSLRRPLVVGSHHIPNGALGVVTVEQDGGGLYDVEFFCDPSIAITISKYDLLHAS